MRRILVVTQSKRDYDKEQFITVKVIMWMASSALFTSLFYLFIKSVDTLMWIFFGFIFLFMFSDLTKNQKLKAYIQIVLGVLFSIWGLLFLYISIFILKTTNSRIPGLILTVIFLYIAYNKISTHTTFFNR